MTMVAPPAATIPPHFPPTNTSPLSDPAPISHPTPIVHHTRTQSQPYTSQAQFTPPSSSEAVSNMASPRSPGASQALPLQQQQHQFVPIQIRKPKLPMYVPAVLRPTEKPQRQSPPKNAQYGISPESLEEATAAGERPAGIVPGMSRIVTEEWGETEAVAVTGPPSRNHWKPDTASPTCDNPLCTRPFTFLTRRHHCRRCGSIFCHEHSAHYVPLDQHAKFHPHAPKHRACNSCWSDYRTWETARVSRSNSTNSRDSTTPGTPTIAMPGGGLGRFNSGLVGKAQASVAKSVPRDWNWSTF